MPRNSKFAAYETIRCSGADLCVAVGESGTWSVLPSAAIWNGKSWNAQLAAKGTSGVLYDVSCLSAMFCAAVGYADGPQRVLATHWDGKVWTRDALPSAITPQSELDAVSCASASNCVAVGRARGVPVIVRWNGSGWNSEAPELPPGAPRTWLNGVSCPASNNCYAVGASALDNSHRYMQHWDGSHWSIVDTPSPQTNPETFDRFSAITCTTQVCTVAGYVASMTASDQYVLFIDRGIGSHWTVEATPPLQPGVAEFTDVACPTATTCYAIGGRRTSGTTQQNLFEQRT
jgi:hypothetical protein